jgi:iron/manganese superoxide dismutase-like protein
MGTTMPYSVKPLGCDPARVKGMSERLIVSHYENNYGGAVKRLNLIEEKLAELDHANAPGFTIHGLKREELIAMNSMILHELFFDGLGDESEPSLALKNAIAHDFGSYGRWRSEFVAMGMALGGGSGWVLLSWPARPQACQSMGGRSLPHVGWWHSDPGTRHVRALLPHRLRREGGQLRRYVHGRGALEKCRQVVWRDDRKRPRMRPDERQMKTAIPSGNGKGFRI